MIVFHSRNRDDVEMKSTINVCFNDFFQMKRDSNVFDV